MDKREINRLSPRLRREYKTADVMISIFCRKHHGENDLCGDCRELRYYTLERLVKCPFREDKPTCAKCPVHCYKPAMRERIREVMRFSGPRMIFRHPILALRHLLDSKKDVPESKTAQGR